MIQSKIITHLKLCAISLDDPRYQILCKFIYGWLL